MIPSHEDLLWLSLNHAYLEKMSVSLMKNRYITLYKKKHCKEYPSLYQTPGHFAASLDRARVSGHFSPLNGLIPMNCRTVKRIGPFWPGEWPMWSEIQHH